MTTTARTRQGTIRECAASSCGRPTRSGSAMAGPGHPLSPARDRARRALRRDARRARETASPATPYAFRPARSVRSAADLEADVVVAQSLPLGLARGLRHAGSDSSSTSTSRPSSRRPPTSRTSSGGPPDREASATRRSSRRRASRSCSATRSSARASGSATTGSARSRRWDASRRPRLRAPTRPYARWSPSCRSASTGAAGVRRPAAKGVLPRHPPGRSAPALGRRHLELVRPADRHPRGWPARRAPRRCQAAVPRNDAPEHRRRRR